MAATQAVVLGVGLGVPVGVLGWMLAPLVFRLVGAPAGVSELGTSYLRIVLLSAPFRMVAMLGSRALQAAQDTATPMIIRVVATLVNVALTVLFVPGLGPAPMLGVTGAAIGTAVGNTLSGVALVAVLASGMSHVGLVRDGWRAPSVLLTTVRIGGPHVLERLFYAVGELPLNAILLVFGTDANAGYQIGRRVQQYLRMPARGFGVAAGALVGGRLGAGRARSADQYGRGAVELAMLASLAMGVLVGAYAQPIAGWFVDDPGAVATASTWIRVLAAATVARGGFGVLRGALQGAGDTRSRLLATVLGMTVFRLGTSWIVGVLLFRFVGWVQVGVALDYTARFAILAGRYTRGAWKVSDRTASGSEHAPGVDGGDVQPTPRR